MRTISLHEAYESGFTIGDIQDLVTKGLEELYEDESRTEVIRKIALSQDSWSFSQTRSYLRRALLLRNPARKYNPEFERVLDTTLIAFYCGDLPMSHFTSLAQAAAYSATLAKSKTQATAIAQEIYEEIQGITYPNLYGFLMDVITPKYQENWSTPDFEAIVLQAVKKLAQDPTFTTSITSPGTWPCFSEAGDYLKVLGNKPVAFQDTAVESYGWSVHRKEFKTPGGLLVGLVTTTERGEMLLEIGKDGASECQRLVLGPTGFIGVGDQERILSFVKTQQNVLTMIAIIRKELT